MTTWAPKVASLAAAASLLVLWAGAWSLRSARMPTERPERIDRPAPARGPARSIGALVRRLAGRDHDPAAERRLGRTVLLTIGLIPIEPMLALVVAAVAAGMSTLRRRSATKRRSQGLVDELPDVVDLLSLAASAGLTVPLAVGVVADRGDGEIALAFSRVRAEVDRGGSLSEALDRLVTELGEEVRGLVRVLSGSIRDGTSIIPALERLAHEVRTDRRRAAEERARRLPVQLLFPLVTCVLPAFALLTVVPLLAGAIGGLSL